MIKLEDTVKLMTSTDYKDRFIAEYMQLMIRIKGLSTMVDKMKNNELDFKPKCTLALLTIQLTSMRDYKYYLELRAEVENIDLGGIR
ncbi:MAG: crAss001_48 related protein [Cetobacterium sp.]